MDILEKFVKALHSGDRLETKNLSFEIAEECLSNEEYREARSWIGRATIYVDWSDDNDISKMIQLANIQKESDKFGAIQTFSTVYAYVKDQEIKESNLAAIEYADQERRNLIKNT